jgi:phytanoyl-CoA hydroxylase
MNRTAAPVRLSRLCQRGDHNIADLGHYPPIVGLRLPLQLVAKPSCTTSKQTLPGIAPPHTQKLRDSPGKVHQTIVTACHHRIASPTTMSDHPPIRPYALSTDQVDQFRQLGYVHLPAVLSEQEVCEIEVSYDRFMNNEVPGMGKDFCDMSGPYDRKLEDYALVNAMLPRIYMPNLQGNIFETVSAEIASQLIGDDIDLDYDQFLAKKPHRPDAKFAWHQDQGYWPANTPDTRTVTCSLAIDDSNKSNGCLRCVPASGADNALRPHRPVTGNREEGHTLQAYVAEDEACDYLEVRRGGITVHDEWVVHGSDGNATDGWRRTYVIAYRSIATIQYERSIGFTHSHNDAINWTTTLGSFEKS